MILLTIEASNYILWSWCKQHLSITKLWKCCLALQKMLLGDFERCFLAIKKMLQELRKKFPRELSVGRSWSCCRKIVEAKWLLWGLTHKNLMVEGQVRVLESQNHRSIEITSVLITIEIFRWSHQQQSH